MRRRPSQWLYNVRGRKHEPYKQSPNWSRTKKGETGEEQSRPEHAHHSLWHQGDYSQIIHCGRPSSQFRILLWRFTATAWKCEKTSPRTLATKELTVASQQRTVSNFLSNQGIVLTKTTWLSSPTQPTCLCFTDWSYNWKAVILAQLRSSRQNRRRCWALSQNTTSRMHLKMAEALEVNFIEGDGGQQAHS
jgi:hypothetical protein